MVFFTENCCAYFWGQLLEDLGHFLLQHMVTQLDHHDPFRATVSQHFFSSLSLISSVTRSGYFWNVLSSNFLVKIAQIFSNFLGCLSNYFSYYRMTNTKLILTYFVRGIPVKLTSSLTDLDSTKQVNLMLGNLLNPYPT